MIVHTMVVSCSHPLDYFYKEIHNYGYIHYTTPLAFSGTGTLIGGRPESMEIVAHPETCFPKEVNGWGKKLRFEDHTYLPRHYENLMIDIDAQGKFFDVMAAGSPSIRAGLKIKEVKKILLEMRGVHVEVMDQIHLVEFYQKYMAGICKDYLELVGFIIQAIKVDELLFTFYRKNNTVINIDMDKINQYLDISLDLDLEIEEGTKLVIKTPKYIGYQLGSLRKSDNGFSLSRASRYRFNQWIFEEIGVFSCSIKVLDKVSEILLFWLSSFISFLVF